MNTFTKKSLYAALAGVSALGATGAAEAVSVNPDGLGQVLIYPYYTVREKVAGAAFNTLLTVVNTTASAKAVKVRFLEGKASNEVLDFNLYLSPKDVWTAAILPTADGAGIVTKDVSCTTPAVSSDPANPTKFVNYQYVGDKSDQSLDRTREGYFEIIEMGAIDDKSTTYDEVIHSPPTYVPSCDLAGVDISSDTSSPTGGLFGSATLINVLAGEDYAYDATAIDNWSQTQQWTDPGSILPNLSAVNPQTSVTQSGSVVYITDWSGNATSAGADTMSALFMHDKIYNEFVLDTVTASGTDWVVTMPTKRMYYSAKGAVSKLFQRNFTSSGACDDVLVTQYDREERTVSTPGSFSPPAPTLTDSICWEANVVTFNGRNVLGSKNTANIGTSFQNGWVSMVFKTPVTGDGATPHFLVADNGSTIFDTTGGGSASSASPTTFTGLPVLGFAAISYNNGVLSTTVAGTPTLVQSQYGGNVNHKSSRAITSGAPAL